MANFKKLPSVKTYKIVVMNGNVDKAKAAAGKIITLTANPPSVGKKFDVGRAAQYSRIRTPCKRRLRCRQGCNAIDYAK